MLTERNFKTINVSLINKDAMERMGGGSVEKDFTLLPLISGKDGFQLLLEI